jgi:type IV pilus assembly protein PilF
MTGQVRGLHWRRIGRAGFCLAALALLGACAQPGEPGSVPTAESRSIVGEVGDPRNRARVRTELAMLYYSRGAMAVALEELRIAAAADPTYAQTFSLFGMVYMELREMALAQANFQRALQLAPNDSEINHNYGYFLCETGKEREAINYFLQAIRNPLYSSPSRSYSEAGRCAMRMNNLSNAEEFLQRALRLDADDPVALLQMGHIRYRQDRHEDARVLVSRYSRLARATPESLWLALRIERKLGQRVAENSFATQLRRSFPDSREYQSLQRGEYD